VGTNSRRAASSEPGREGLKLNPLSVPAATRRLGAAAAGVALLVGVLPAQAQAAPIPEGAARAAATTGDAQRAADYDSRDSLAAAAAAAPSLSPKRAVAEPSTTAVRKLRDSLGIQGIVDIDGATGTPRRVAKLDGYLTGASRSKPATIALNYVKAHSAVFGLDAAAVAGLTLRQDYIDVAGIHHLSFVQTLNGVPVFGNGLKAHVARNGRLIQLDGSPLAALPATAGSTKLSAAGGGAAAGNDVAATTAPHVTKL
jgi:extracellular elastinolytic metalloproteinase